MNDLTNSEIQTLEKILIKFINYLNITKIYDFTNIVYKDHLIKSILLKTNHINSDVSNELIICDNNVILSNSLIENNTIIRINDTSGFNLCYSTNTKISIRGKYFDFNFKNDTINDFKVLAIMHVYNEEDIIEKTIEHLINQNIDVYVIDNWSKDQTHNIVLKLIEKYPNRIFLEKFPLNKDNKCYDWTHQLQRTEELSKTLNYNWFIHYDADECRITPWKDITLKEMIYMADKLGFNIIENTVIDFKIINKNQNNIFMEDTYFVFGMRPGHFSQLKTWKKNINVDLKTSGGHVASIPNTKIYPLKILNKHYPFRSVQQATNKVFIDRKQRYTKKERDIGWHIQYDLIKTDDDLIEKDISKLILWGKNITEKYYVNFFIDARF